MPCECHVLKFSEIMLRPSILTRNIKRLFSSSPASKNAIVVSGKVQSAVRNGEPVVALESTIITHGMPYPHNLQTALNVEDIIRSKVVNFYFILFLLILQNCIFRALCPPRLLS